VSTIKKSKEETMKTRVVAAVAAGFALMLASGAAVEAAEIKVVSTIGVKPALPDLVAAFERTTGHKVAINWGNASTLKSRYLEGAEADVAILTAAAINDLNKAGKVGARTDLCRWGMGLGGKAGAPKPDIGTPEAFKRAMLDAKSIGHTNAGTGPFNTRLFQKLGIYDQIKDRIKIIEGRLVAEAVAAGDIEIGIQQTNVIQPVAGSEYLGQLPPELMEYARIGVGLLTVSEQPEVANAFIRFMADPANAALLKKGAMEPPLR
jgi:molybdate transport system substrate-binding protein